MKDKCLNPTCPRDSNTRGLCKSCYHTAGRLIKEGRVTWDTLIAQGKAHAPGMKGSGRVIAWFLDGTPNELPQTTDEK